jgi:hypothetical protein
VHTYLAGYAVEGALKACFAKSVQRYDFPDKNRAAKIFIHKLSELAKLANLDSELAAATQPGSKLAGSWLLVCNWTEESRYATWTKDQAEGIIEAIVGRTSGVLPWIKQRW